MVCIPCIIAPILLFVWYRFIQPLVLKIWNPWAPKKAVKDSDSAPTAETASKLTCPFKPEKQEVNDTTETKLESSSVPESDKKND